MEKEFVEFLAKSLVDFPDEVSVSIVEGERSTIVELRVAQGDIGKIIGKRGRIAQAMRTLLNAVSASGNKRIVLEILD